MPKSAIPTEVSIVLMVFEKVMSAGTSSIPVCAADHVLARPRHRALAAAGPRQWHGRIWLMDAAALSFCHRSAR